MTTSLVREFQICDQTDIASFNTPYNDLDAGISNRFLFAIAIFIDKQEWNDDSRRNAFS